MSICALALKYKVNKGTLRAHIDPNHISIDVFNATKQALSPTQEDVLWLPHTVCPPTLLP